MTLAELEQQERALATVRERVFHVGQQRNTLTVAVSVHENWLREFRDTVRPDAVEWIAALERIKATLLARKTELEAAIGAPPPDDFANHDPMVAYGLASTRRRMTNLQREELSILEDSLKTIEKGGFGNSELPALLVAEGIRPLPGYTAVYRGRMRVPLPRAKNALEALDSEIARHEAELAKAQAALAALDAEDIAPSS